MSQLENVTENFLT